MEETLSPSQLNWKQRDNEMNTLICILAVFAAFSLVGGCDGSSAPATPPPARTAQATATPVPTATSPTSACPPTSSEGTVPPAIAIYSITFIVNGLEQVVRGDDMLQASSGDAVQVREVTICVEPFSGNGGEACVEFTPIDQNGQEMVSEGNGTHMKRVTPGLISIPGPNNSWTIGENWRLISAVLNHWPPDGSNDPSCGGGLCEHDDQVVISIQQ